MKPIVLGVLSCLVGVQPALARSNHRHLRHHAHGTREIGVPITAQSSSIRINRVGEVISTPTQLIRNDKARNARGHDKPADKAVANPNGDGPARP